MGSKYAFALFFLQVPFLFPTTSAWNGTTSNVWNNSVATNWTPNAVPQIAGDVAQFNVVDAANTDVTLTQAIVVGTILIDSASNYSIVQGVGGSLSFSVSSGSAAININNTNGNGTQLIQIPFTMLAPLIITQNSTANFEISGAIAGGSTQTLTTTGTGTTYLSGTNTYTGGTIVTGGTLNIEADANLGNSAGTLSIGNATLLDFGTFSTSRAVSLTGTATISVIADTTLTMTGAITGAGSLTKAGSGTLTLTSTSNTYQSGTLLNAGTLSISSDSNLGDTAGSLTLGSGTLYTTSNITSARSVTVSGNAIIDTRGNTDLFSGVFSGPGSLTLSSGAGAGTVNLTGASGQSSYTGGTTVSANTTLTGTTNGIQGNIALSASSSNLIFNQSFDGTYIGTLTGTGPLTKTGSGTVTFSGTSSSYTGDTTISAGTLAVTGSLANSEVAISANGTLSGSGTVGSTTSTGGTIDPGTSAGVGTLSVNGTLTLDSNSTVNITTAPTSADQIAVTGAAAIDGALSVEIGPGFYGFGQSYTILTSSNISGTFDSATTNNSAINASLTYPSSTSVLLHIDVPRPFALLSLSNFNTIAVGNNIDDLHVAGQLSTALTNIVNSFIGLSTDAINSALDEMHPAPYTAFTEMQTETGAALLSLFHRLPYLPCCCNNPNRFWIEPFGNTLTMKRKGIQFGFQANTAGVAFGYDRSLADNLVLGIGGAWNYSELDWHHHHGHGEVNGFYGGIYFDSQFDAFYLGATLLAGADFYDTSRHIEFVTTNEHAKASYQALDIMAQLEMAYLFGSPQAFFYPYANIDYLYLQPEAFSETGAEGINLSVAEYGDGTLRTEMGLGFQVQDKNRDETICISPQVSLGWVGMWPLQRPLIEATFEGATIPFQVKGWDESWDLLKADFGLIISYRCYSLKLQYDVEISPDSDTTLFNQHGNIRFDWKW